MATVAETEGEVSGSGSAPIELDLKIIVRGTNEDTGLTDEEVYNVNGKEFATYSKYVADAMAGDLKAIATREIVFEDTCPATFDVALKYVEHPAAEVFMKPEEVLQIVEFYDAYQFSGGMQICDNVLVEFIKPYVGESQFPKDLDLLVNAISAAHTYGLAKSAKLGTEFYKMLLESTEFPRCGSVLTLEHAMQLQPLFIEDVLRNGNDELLGRLGVTQEELESDLFPKYFVERESKRYSEQPPECLILTASNDPRIDGKYHLNPQSCYPHYVSGAKITWDEDEDQEGRCNIGTNVHCDADWSIWFSYLGENNRLKIKILFMCPFSRNLEYPPREGWISTDESTAKMTPPLVQSLIFVDEEEYVEEDDEIDIAELLRNEAQWNY